MLGAAGYTVVLQLAFPTVAAAVTEHSTYKRDLWGRLLRSLDYLYLMSYGGSANAAITARCLRAKHAPIRGTLANGRRYTAFERDAWSWVHATLIDGAITGIERFCGRLTAAERDGLWREWLATGRLIGVNPDDLPADWAGYRAYRERMLADRLEPTPAIHEFLATLRRPTPPRAVPAAARTAWHLLRLPLGRLLHLVTVGLLPARLRDAAGLPWGPRQELELNALAATTRGVGPVLPPTLRNIGPRYLEWRQEPIAADFERHGAGASSGS